MEDSNYKYIKTPESIIALNDVAANNYSMSASTYKRLVIPNINGQRPLRYFLSRELTSKDLGSEVGSESYIDSSPVSFLRTKGLTQYSYLPDFNPESLVPIKPKVFEQHKLSQGDVIISKDSNIGEAAILDKDYPNIMLSGAIYKLPLKEKYKYYVFAFIKHDIFREQLDYLVPKGATIRHAKTRFLDCIIPLPKNNITEVVPYISKIVKIIVSQESIIHERHEKILRTIEKELIENQNGEPYSFKYPTISEIQTLGRLDNGLYNPNFKYWKHQITNYKYGHVNLKKRGFEGERGSSLEMKSLRTRLDSDEYISGYYELIIPTFITKYGYVENSNFIGTPAKLKTIKKGDIIFGGEGFGKGRSFVVLDNVHNIATNYHGIRIVNKHNDIKDSVFVRCILAFLRSKGIIDDIGVGGSGGHCSPAYFHLIETPLFPINKRDEVNKLYYSGAEFPANLTMDNIDSLIDAFNKEAGIYELYNSIKYFHSILDKTLEKIINNQEVDVSF